MLHQSQEIRRELVATYLALEVEKEDCGGHCGLQSVTVRENDGKWRIIEVSQEAT